MLDRESKQQWENLLSEFDAACTALDLANSEIDALLGTGARIEQLDLEFHAESRARAVVTQALQRIETFKAAHAEPWLQVNATSALDLRERRAGGISATNRR